MPGDLPRTYWHRTSAIGTGLAGCLFHSREGGKEQEREGEGGGVRDVRVVDLLPGMREDVYVFVVWNVCFGSLDEGASGVCVCVCVNK